MLTSAFNFSLNNPIQEGGAVVARIDGKNICLICVTLGGKVFIYTPQNSHDTKKDDSIQFLNLNKQITCIAVGSFQKDSQQNQLLFMASANTLLAFDVEKNSEKFYKEVSDGVSVVGFGQMYGFTEQPLAIIGGNCSIQGFDETSNEVYWNVTSDKVTSICLSDIDGDNILELIVGSDDNYIRVFKNEEILYEISEAGPSKCLCSMSKSRFAFGLENGMVGVYNKKARKWRAKSQIKPIAMVQGNFDKDEGYRPLVIGRVNGNIEIRHDQTGETLHKVAMNENLANLMQDDFRGDGTQQIIAIGVQGTVKGYTISANREVVTDQSSTQQKLEMQEQIDQLQKKKHNLMIKYQSLQDGQNNLDSKSEDLMLPKDTKIAQHFVHNLQLNQIEMVIQSSKNTYLKAAILFNDKMFNGESYFHCPKKITDFLKIPIKYDKNTKEQLRAKVIIGASPHSQYYQVFDMETLLPRFCNYLWVEDFSKYKVKPPQGKLQIYINERIPRYMKWLEQSFILESSLIEEFDKISEKQDKQFNLDGKFINVQDMSSLSISVNSKLGTVLIGCDSIEVTGQLIQDLCQYMNISELDSQGEFPDEMLQFKKILTNVEKFKSSRMNITADIADSVNNVKTLIVKAEDARMQGDMAYMRKYYADVMGENNTLTTELLKRQKNTETLTDSLKEINSMINKAANLRLGSHKIRVTNLCRNAIKNNNLHSLIFIIENGKDM